MHPIAVETLEQAGYSNIEYHKKSLPDHELKKSIANAHFVGIRSRTQISEEILDNATKFIAVGGFAKQKWLAGHPKGSLYP